MASGLRIDFWCRFATLPCTHQAALSDVFLGSRLAKNSGTIAIWVGAGVMFGPWLGSKARLPPAVDH